MPARTETTRGGLPISLNISVSESYVSRAKKTELQLQGSEYVMSLPISNDSKMSSLAEKFCTEIKSKHTSKDWNGSLKITLEGKGDIGDSAYADIRQGKAKVSTNTFLALINETLKLPGLIDISIVIISPSAAIGNEGNNKALLLHSFLSEKCKNKPILCTVETPLFLIFPVDHALKPMELKSSEKIFSMLPVLSYSNQLNENGVWQYTISSSPGHMKLCSVDESMLTMQRFLYLHTCFSKLLSSSSGGVISLGNEELEAFRYYTILITDVLLKAPSTFHKKLIFGFNTAKLSEPYQGLIAKMTASLSGNFTVFERLQKKVTGGKDTPAIDSIRVAATPSPGQKPLTYFHLEASSPPSALSGSFAQRAASPTSFSASFSRILYLMSSLIWLLKSCRIRQNLPIHLLRSCVQKTGINKTIVGS